jgi:hypothetical protein
MPDLPIVAEGENARGEHWYLKAAGSPADYYTMLDTLHPDGRRDEGGMGGAPLYPGSRYNSYSGRADDGPLRVIVRTDPQVRRLRLSIRTTRDETLDLLPLAEDPEVGLVFFATLLPQPAELLSIQGFRDPHPSPATHDSQPRESSLAASGEHKQPPVVSTVLMSRKSLALGTP